MTKKFILELELENDEMRTMSHVAVALMKVADKITGSSFKGDPGQRILDNNGNTVGYWRVTDAE